MDKPRSKLSATGDQYSDASNLNCRIALHARFSTNTYGWHRWVFDQLDTGPNARILELGCGSGILWKENTDRIGTDWDIVLSDQSPGMLEEARRNLLGHGGGMAFQIVDAESIPFPDMHFDVVIANHMLYHVPGKARALSEIRRVLKVGGTLYAATNGSDHLKELGELMARFGVGGSGEASFRSFTLENGLEQLAPWLEEISSDRYDDALYITEVDPLIAYIRSLDSAFSLESKLSQLAEFLQREIAQHGKVVVRKSTGMFIARRQRE